MIKRKIPESVMTGNSTQFAQVIPYSGQISFGYNTSRTGISFLVSLTLLLVIALR